MNPAQLSTHDPKAAWINRSILYRSIDPGEIVAQIAPSEILHVPTGEVLTLAVTAARIEAARNNRAWKSQQ